MKNDSANRSIPTVGEASNDAFTSYPDPPKNLITVPEIEDLWVGPCSDCGYAVFSGEEFVVEGNKPVCSACVVERCSWFKLTPVVKRIA